MGFAPKMIAAAGLPFYYVSFAFAAVSLLLIYLVIKSKLGLAFRAIHQNEQDAK